MTLLFFLQSNSLWVSVTSLSSEPYWKTTAGHCCSRAAPSSHRSTYRTREICRGLWRPLTSVTKATSSRWSVELMRQWKLLYAFFTSLSDFFLQWDFFLSLISLCLPPFAPVFLSFTYSASTLSLYELNSSSFHKENFFSVKFQIRGYMYKQYVNNQIILNEVFLILLLSNLRSFG
jgi:hypothetical protein